MQSDILSILLFILYFGLMLELPLEESDLVSLSFENCITILHYLPRSSFFGKYFSKFENIQSQI